MWEGSWRFLKLSITQHHGKWKGEGGTGGTQELIGMQRVLQVVPVGQVLAEDVQVHSVGSLGCTYPKFIFAVPVLSLV